MGIWQKQLAKMLEHPNQSQSNPGQRADGTPCMFVVVSLSASLTCSFLSNRFVCDVLKLANYLMMDHLVVADCNALMGGTGEVRSGLLGRYPSFIMTYLKVS